MNFNELKEGDLFNCLTGNTNSDEYFVFNLRFSHKTQLNDNVTKIVGILTENNQHGREFINHEIDCVLPNDSLNKEYIIIDNFALFIENNETIVNKMKLAVKSHLFENSNIFLRKYRYNKKNG